MSQEKQKFKTSPTFHLSATIQKAVFIGIFISLSTLDIYGFFGKYSKL